MAKEHIDAGALLFHDRLAAGQGPAGLLSRAQLRVDSADSALPQ
jgi:hypothetical protein